MPQKSIGEIVINWHNGELLAFDTESTGVNPETDRIVSASIVYRQESVATISWLINPGVPVGESQKIHGFSDEYLLDHGRQPKEVLPEIVNRLSTCDCPVIVFNAAFDMTLLDREMRRHNVCQERHGKEFHPIIDPFVIDRHTDKFRKGKRNLKAICEHYGIKPFDHHQAGQDALAAMRLAWKLGSIHHELADAHPNEVHEWQKGWYRIQAEGLRAFFTKTMNQSDHADDIIKLQAKINDVNDEWPLRITAQEY